MQAPTNPFDFDTSFFVIICNFITLHTRICSEENETVAFYENFPGGNTR